MCLVVSIFDITDKVIYEKIIKKETIIFDLFTVKLGDQKISISFSSENVEEYFIRNENSNDWIKLQPNERMTIEIEKDCLCIHLKEQKIRDLAKEEEIGTEIGTIDFFKVK